MLAIFGECIAPVVRHFEIGDFVGMTHAALEFQSVPGANVYAPLAVIASGSWPATARAAKLIFRFRAWMRGRRRQRQGQNRANIACHAGLHAGNESRQFSILLLFDKPLAPANAKPLLQALKRATGADCADDMSHVWRVDGTLNYPGTRQDCTRQIARTIFGARDPTIE